MQAFSFDSDTHVEMGTSRGRSCFEVVSRANSGSRLPIGLSVHHRFTWYEICSREVSQSRWQEAPRFHGAKDSACLAW